MYNEINKVYSLKFYVYVVITLKNFIVNGLSTLYFATSIWNFLKKRISNFIEAFKKTLIIINNIINNHSSFLLIFNVISIMIINN